MSLRDILEGPEPVTVRAEDYLWEEIFNNASTIRSYMKGRTIVGSVSIDGYPRLSWSSMQECTEGYMLDNGQAIVCCTVKDHGDTFQSGEVTVQYFRLVPVPPIKPESKKKKGRK